MNKNISKYFFYYPSTFLKGEFHWKHNKTYENFQYQPLDKIYDYQKKELLALIEYSIKHKPYYTKLYQNIDLTKIRNYTLQEILQTLPTISKASLITHAPEMSTKKHPLSAEKTTGGSTGEPVQLFKNPDALSRERVATARSYKWANVDIGDAQARFWGVPHQKKGKFKAKMTDIIANRYRLSAFDLSQESFRTYHKQLTLKAPKYLYGYVSAIRAFTKFMAENNLPTIPSINSIITTSEVLSETDRKFFEKIWKVKVFNEYGCGEVGSIAHECEDGNLHIMSDNLIVEVDNKANPDKPGELIITDLHNKATPLIRYRVGDFSQLSGVACSCGKTLPTLKGIYGRAYDLIETPEGNCLHPESVIYIFEQLQSEYKVIRQFQVIQTKSNDFIINIVASKDFTDKHKDQIIAQFREHISKTAKVNINFVDEIPREKSGKLRLVKRMH